MTGGGEPTVESRRITRLGARLRSHVGAVDVHPPDPHPNVLPLAGPPVRALRRLRRRLRPRVPGLRGGRHPAAAPLPALSRHRPHRRGWRRRLPERVPRVVAGAAPPHRHQRTAPASGPGVQRSRPRRVRPRAALRRVGARTTGAARRRPARHRPGPRLGARRHEHRRLGRLRRPARGGRAWRQPAGGDVGQARRQGGGALQRRRRRPHGHPGRQCRAPPRDRSRHARLRQGRTGGGNAASW